MTTLTLTNTAIDALPAGRELKDNKVPGLCVRRHASGVSFLFYYRSRTGQARRPKLGNYPTLSIADARRLAGDLAVKVAGGADPVAERRIARDEPAMAELWERMAREVYNKPDTKAWHKEAARLWRVAIKPKLGSTMVRAVDYEGCYAMHRAQEANPVQANRALAVLSKMMKQARRWGMRTGDNPCRDVERFPERSRQRYAQPAEVQTIGPILERHARDPAKLPGCAFLYLLIFSGARPSEVGRAAPSQVEAVEVEGIGRCGVLRIADGKTGETTVYLPPQAMAVLDRLPHGRDALAGRTTMPKKLWGEIRKEAGCPDLWARDWRRTFGTTALSGDVTLGQVGELLNHASVQTTKIYAKLQTTRAHTAAAATAGTLERLLRGAECQTVEQAAEQNPATTPLKSGVAA